MNHIEGVLLVASLMGVVMVLGLCLIGAVSFSIYRSISGLDDNDDCN